MNLQQAQDLYTECREETLSPAMRLALQQYFDRNPEAQEDYNAFCLMLDSFERVTLPVLEPPHGFRAALLERLEREQTSYKKTGLSALSVTLQDWLGGSSLRKLAGAGIGALALIGVVVASVHNHAAPGQAGSLGIDEGAAAPQVQSTVFGVAMKTGDDGNEYHLFRVHLPDSVPSAVVTAEVLTDNAQISDPARRSQQAEPALKQPIDLTNDEEMQIPVAVLQQPSTGSTLTMLVQWQPDDARIPAGSQVVFTPVDAQSIGSNVPVAPPTTLGYYDALQFIASTYHVTVISDSSADPHLSIMPWPETSDPAEALRLTASDSGYTLRAIDNHTYQLYK